MEPLEVLFEPDGLPAADLPDELARLYGGPLGIKAPRLFANFVATTDGVLLRPVGSVSVVEFGSHGPLVKALADRSHLDERLRNLPGT